MKILSIIVIAICGACLGHVSASVTGFSYAGFNESQGLMMKGKTKTVGSILRLIGFRSGVYGQAFYNTTIPMLQTTWNSSCQSASFKAKFSFRIYNDGRKCHAAGIGFAVLGSNVDFKQLVSGGLGETLGLQYDGYPKVGSLITIFDTYRNSYDPKHRYVGVRENFALPTVAYNYTSVLDDFRASVKHAWIEYDGTLETLHVYLSKTTKRPAMPEITYQKSLCELLRPSACAECQNVTEAYIGLTAGTGACGDNHDIIGWSFSSWFD